MQPAELSLLSALTRGALAQAAVEQRWPWYFFGPAGAGKTFIAAACYRHFSARGQGRGARGENGHERPPIWLEAGEMLMTYVLDRHAAHKIRNTWRDAALVCLDDVGVREASPAQLDALLTLLNLRDGLPLMLTGNCGEAELREVLDDRCVSRICSGQPFEVLGADRRMQGARLFEI